MLEWMAWSPPVAIFFICVVLMLACMTYLEIRFPTVARKGFFAHCDYAWRQIVYWIVRCSLYPFNFSWLGWCFCAVAEFERGPQHLVGNCDECCVVGFCFTQRLNRHASNPV